MIPDDDAQPFEQPMLPGMAPVEPPPQQDPAPSPMAPPGPPTAHTMHLLGRVDEGTLISEAEEFYRSRSSERRPYEIQWYLNAAALRGHTTAHWNILTAKLQNPASPSYKRTSRINRIRAIFMAKIAKYVNGQIRPQVLPASTDREDLLNAKGTEQLLQFLHRKLDLEGKYEQALGWAEICGKAFWWFRWDDLAPVQTYTPKDALGQRQIETQALGEVAVDVTPAFQVLVDDQGVEAIGKQRRIMRVWTEPLGQILARPEYQQFAGKLRPDVQDADVFQYQQQIADLGQRQLLTGVEMPGGAARAAHVERDPMRQLVIRKEMYEAPSAQYPEGRFWVVAGGQVLRYFETLPYGWGRISDNPFPCEEFSAGHNPGQFWPTTMVEQLIPVAQEYDELRQRMAEALAMTLHPVLLTPKQARVPVGAFTTAPGQRAEWYWIPGMPPPSYLEPRNVNSDAWRQLDRLIGEFAEVSNIHPDSMGQAGATSGFQTNLLQEAADQVHQPERRRNERALARAYGKIRRLAKIYYDGARLVQVGGRGRLPEVLELTHDQIDEHAEILVQIGSALPDQKTARVQAILELHGSGLFGAPGDPEVARKVLGMIDLGGMEAEFDTLRRDEDAAQLENLRIMRGEQVPGRMPWDNDLVHAKSHLDEMKAPDFAGRPREVQAAVAEHALGHLSRIPQFLPIAVELAQLYQLPQLPALMQQQQMLAMQQAPMGPQPGAPSPGPGGPPQGGPPTPAPAAAA